MGRVQLLAGGADVAKPDAASLPSPLSIWWTAFAPAAPAANGTFASGGYVCHFSGDGNLSSRSLSRSSPAELPSIAAGARAGIQPLVLSSNCRRSCAASSISLWRHSAAR
jgi:hypothetical protein